MHLTMVHPICGPLMLLGARLYPQWSYFILPACVHNMCAPTCDVLQFLQVQGQMWAPALCTGDLAHTHAQTEHTLSTVIVYLSPYSIPLCSTGLLAHVLMLCTHIVCGKNMHYIWKHHNTCSIMLIPSHWMLLEMACCVQARLASHPFA